MGLGFEEKSLYSHIQNLSLNPTNRETADPLIVLGLNGVMLMEPLPVVT